MPPYSDAIPAAGLASVQDARPIPSCIAARDTGISCSAIIAVTRRRFLAHVLPAEIRISNLWEEGHNALKKSLANISRQRALRVLTPTAPDVRAALQPCSNGCMRA